MVFPKKYIRLNLGSVKLNGLELVPIRFEDRIPICNWRNEQMLHLRQVKKLTEEDQNNYFKTVVAKLYEEDQPNQILFSLLEDKKIIAYGGLVHINWVDKHAEVSFLMDTQLQKDRFGELWTVYSKMIKHIAFDILGFRKIFTYAFDIRPHLYRVLENVGFVEEARLKDHCCINGEFKDVLIHSMFAGPSINFREAQEGDVQLYFDWANDPLVRSQSFQSKEINFEDHLKWFHSKVNNDDTLMLLFSDPHGYIGQVRIEQKEEGNVISVSLDSKNRGKGYASRILRLGAIEGKKRFGGTIIAYIRNDNKASVRSFESAGFVLGSNLKINKIPSFKYIYE